MKMSNLELNEIGILRGKKFIVTDRTPDDRASGSTTIRFETGDQEIFVWDFSNPVVTKVGKGRIEIKIIEE